LFLKFFNKKHVSHTDIKNYSKHLAKNTNKNAEGWNFIQLFST